MRVTSDSLFFNFLVIKSYAENCQWVIHSMLQWFALKETYGFCKIRCITEKLELWLSSDSSEEVELDFGLGISKET